MDKICDSTCSVKLAHVPCKQESVIVHLGKTKIRIMFPLESSQGKQTRHKASRNGKMSALQECTCGIWEMHWRISCACSQSQSIPATWYCLSHEQVNLQPLERQAKSFVFPISLFPGRPGHTTCPLVTHGIWLGALSSSGEAKAGRAVSPLSPVSAVAASELQCACCIFWLFSADYSKESILKQSWKEIATIITVLCNRIARPW